MSTTQTPWTNQFSTPTVAQLRRGLQADAADIFDRTRKVLLKFDGVNERLRWYGDCWFWTIGYFIEQEQLDDDDPVAMLIPAAEDLQLAMPLETEFMATINVRRLKRAIRDGLELGQEPFHTRWAVWSLSAANVTEEVLSVVTARQRWLMG